jgi:uncharacterized protein (TIGR02246 family)
MRILFNALTTIVMAVSLFAQTPSPTIEDQLTIRNLVYQYMAARDHQDAAALEALLTPDADQLVSSGERRKGRAEVVKGTLASSQNTGGKRTISVTSVRFLAPGVAIADGRYELTGLAGGEDRKMWTSLIMTRTSDGWLIAGIRNMVPAAAAPSK